MKKKTFFYLLAALSLMTCHYLQAENQTLLKGIITLMPIPTIDNPPEQMVPGQIQSGIEVAVQVKVKNEGKLPSQPGKIFVQYHFPQNPLFQHLKPLFQTEVQVLASLNPGEEKVYQFANKQRMPTLYDFVREDWGKREYQVIAQFDDTNQNLGVLHLAFSAHYYEAPIVSSLAAVPAIPKKG